MRVIRIEPVTFQQMAAAVKGDPRSLFHAGGIYALQDTGSHQEIHIHLTVVDRAPRKGGRTSLGITVLPYDVRWNRLWDKACAHDQLPMFRRWLWDLMSETNKEVDAEMFLAAQQDDPT